MNNHPDGKDRYWQEREEERRANWRHQEYMRNAAIGIYDDTLNDEEEEDAEKDQRGACKREEA
jgi:hypothetical protein